jgi:hypothetical protein
MIDLPGDTSSFAYCAAGASNFGAESNGVIRRVVSRSAYVSSSQLAGGDTLAIPRPGAEPHCGWSDPSAIQDKSTRSCARPHPTTRKSHVSAEGLQGCGAGRYGVNAPRQKIHYAAAAGWPPESGVIRCRP